MRELHSVRPVLTWCGAARCLGQVLLQGVGEDVRGLEGPQEELLELPELRQVRLYQDAASEDCPPGPETPELQAQTAQQPDGGGGQLDVLQVLRHGLHVLGLEDQGNHGPGPVQAPDERLHGEPDVVLVRPELQHLLDPQTQAGGLGEEAGHAVVGGRYQGHLTDA